MVHAIKSLLCDVLDRIDEARFARLRQRLPVNYKCIEMDGKVHLFHYMWYDVPDCSASAGYVGLREMDGKLYVCSLVERDFHRPRFEESVFINGKKLATQPDGVRVEQPIPEAAEIIYMGRKKAHRRGRTHWVPDLVKVLPLPVAPSR